MTYTIANENRDQLGRALEGQTYQINGMAITVRGDNGTRFDVLSGSGNTYHITYAGSGDDENVHIWKCDCPAGQRGRDCKHAQAVCEIAADADGEGF